MKSEKRKKLKAEDALMLSRRKDGKEAQECRILSVEGEGGSTVCYSAVYGGKRGRLKEFYPTKASYGKICRLISLTRSTDGQLIAEKPEEQMQYREMCEEFFKVYRMLDEKKIADEAHEILNNYLPVYHLLYGVCERDNSLAGVYVWTPDDTHGQSFDEYLKEIHRNPSEEAVHKLYYVISTLRTLTECIQALHQVGIHQYFP